MENKKDMTYQEAVKELENIVAQIENEDIPVDELLDKVKRSSELIRFCQNKLTQTEEEVNQVLQTMNQETSPSSEQENQMDKEEADDNSED